MRKVKTKEEKRTEFIEKTNYLKGAGLTFKQIAEAIEVKEKRMRNLRSTKPPHIFPNDDELRNVLELYEERCSKEDLPPEKQASIEERLNALEGRVKALEALHTIERLTAENALLKAKLRAEDPAKLDRLH